MTTALVAEDPWTGRKALPPRLLFQGYPAATHVETTHQAFRRLLEAMRRFAEVLLSLALAAAEDAAKALGFFYCDGP